MLDQTKTTALKVIISQTLIPLKDGSALKLTTAKYYTPKGISIQTTGISPHILVKPKNNKVKEILTENIVDDIQLHIAIDFLKNKNNILSKASIALM